MSINYYGPADYSGYLFVQGFQPAVTSNTTMTFAAGSASAYTNGFVMQYPGNIPNLPGNITVNTANIGLNGVFPVALAAVTPESGWAVLPVYLVANSSGTTDGNLNGTVAPGIVIGTGAAFLPAGFDSYLQIGIAIIDSSGNLVPYVQNGSGVEREICFHDGQQILNAGASGTYAKVDITLLPEDNITAVNFAYAFTPGAAADTASIAPWGLTVSSRAPVVIKAAAAVAIDGVFTMAVGDDAGVAAIQYVVSGTDTLSLWVSGFRYCLPLPGSI
jgi:hypothetical protein